MVVAYFAPHFCQMVAKNKMNIHLKNHERVDDLQIENLKIIQSDKYFCMGLDTVLLANFTRIKKADSVCELGSGTGALPLLLWSKEKTAHFTGIELMPELAEAFSRTIKLNQLEDNIKILNIDLKNAPNTLGKAKFSLVVTNPPYAPINIGRISENDLRASAMSEKNCTLEDVIKTASLLLNSEGRFAMVHRPNRIIEILTLMEKYRLTPKRLQLIQPNANSEANILLVEGIKNGKAGLRWEKTLNVYEQTGCYSEDVRKIFGSDKEMKL